MPICPKGHNSIAEDYCDECGALIGASAVPGEPGTAGVPGTTGASGAPGAPGAGEPAATGAETCPICGSPRIGRFCEEDGYDFVLRPPVSAAAPEPWPAAESPTYGQPTTEPPTRTPGRPASAGAREPTPAKPWVAVVTADRDYYETIIAQNGPDAASITFPAVCPERRIQLTGDQILIGRQSSSRGLNPQIDLSGPPEDPGVSHLHAVLQSTSDGGWTITDPGSTNGTTINDETQPIQVGVPVPIRPGDRIHVGAWTTLTLTPQP